MVVLFSGKSKKAPRTIFWGLALILSAVVLILDAAGIFPLRGEGFTPLRIIFGLLLVAWAVTEVVQRKPIDAIFPLAILFLVFETPIAHALGKGDDLISNWIVILSALLLTVGLNMIFRPSSDR